MGISFPGKLLKHLTSEPIETLLPSFWIYKLALESATFTQSNLGVLFWTLSPLPADLGPLFASPFLSSRT